MQINSLNNKAHPKQCRYDFPLRPSQPNTRRSPSPVVRAYKSGTAQESSNSIFKVLEVQQYATLQVGMQLKLKSIQENIKICRQKSKIKDKEMQSLAELIGKLSKKIGIEQVTMRRKEKQLQSISTKCQEMASLVSSDQDKIKKEEDYLNEEAKKYSSLQDMITSLEEAIKAAQYQLQRKQKIYESLQAIESDNKTLKQHYNQLLNQEKLIEYREHHEKNECEEMEKKIQHLTTVLKERIRINKNNSSKLVKLSKEVEVLEEAIRPKKTDSNEIKHLQLDIGDLNQELLLLNDEVAEFQFKIKRKQQVLDVLRTKLQYYRCQVPLPIQSAQKQIKEIPKALKVSNNIPVDLAHQTPTFPSNYSNEIYFNSEPPKAQTREEDNNGKEAFRNIQKLIKRYEQIKGKEKNGQ